MQTVILSHRVNDYNHWKKYYDADRERRTNAGLKELAVGRRTDDRQNVYMIYQTSNAAEAQKMMDDPNLKAVMKEAGVISEPNVMVID